jgi:hypothetical protein
VYIFEIKDGFFNSIKGKWERNNNAVCQYSVCTQISQSWREFMVINYFFIFFFSNSCHCFHSWHARLQLKVNKSIVVNYKKYNKPSIDARIIDSSFENGVDSWKLMDKTYAAQFTTKK